MLFDIAPAEFLVIAGAAIIFIGPKDMPRALRTAGRWLGKMRRMSNHVRSGFEAMIREAELAEMEEQWRAQNAAIMAAHPPENFPQPVTAEAMSGAATAAPAPAVPAAPSAVMDAASPELPLPGAGPKPRRAAKAKTEAKSVSTSPTKPRTRKVRPNDGV